MIPKILHVFWRGPPMVIVEACIQRMRVMHPNWDVRRYSDFDEADPVEGFDKLEVQSKTDWLRLCLIEKHGGVWLDSSIICNGTIEQCMDLNETRVVGFECPIGEGVLESWAFGARPNHPFITAWKQEFRRAIVMGYDAYYAAYPHKDHAIYQSMPYLTIHGAFLVVSPRFPDAVVMHSSTDKEYGPYYFIEKEWKTKTDWWAVTKLCIWDYDYPPLLKLTGPRRKQAELHIRLWGISKNSFMYRTLAIPYTERWYVWVMVTFVLLLLVLVLLGWGTAALIRRA